MNNDSVLPAQLQYLEEHPELPPEKYKPYRAPRRPGRNDDCPCKSGKKWKKCCMAEYDEWMRSR